MACDLPQMKYINKYSVGMVVLTLVILGYTVDILPDRINVELPSAQCGTTLLRVTKDDFTLKCGSRIAFQADTIVEYFKTYGPDEWVRNFRYVGRAKKSITLELFEYENKFDIVRTTRYRKGRQYLEDGILQETYTFTPDKVKITYDYQVNNKAKHRISMRVKKQYNSYLDPFDPFGNTAIQKDNLLYYEGYGNLLIDPTITLHSPADNTIDFNEGDTIPFQCSINQSNDSTLSSVKLYWSAADAWESNGSITVTGNSTVTFSRVIPHPTSASFPGTFDWSCEGINTTCTSNDDCTFASNQTVDPRYKPETPNIISPNDTDINLLNGSGPDWNLNLNYVGLGSFNATSSNQSIWINWSHAGLRDNSTGLTFNLSYFGVLNSTRRFDNFFNYNASHNTTIYAEWNVSNLLVDSYFITLKACNALNDTLCENVTTLNSVDIFDYNVNITTGETSIRFSPQPTITKGAALGQTNSQGIIEVDWIGAQAPDGQVNLSINLTATDKCMTLYALDSNTPSLARELVNQTYTTALNNTGSDPDYIWLWADKTNCGTTTTAFSIDLDLFFGGPR